MEDLPLHLHTLEQLDGGTGEELEEEEEGEVERDRRLWRNHTNWPIFYRGFRPPPPPEPAPPPPPPPAPQLVVIPKCCQIYACAHDEHPNAALPLCPCPCPAPHAAPGANKALVDPDMCEIDMYDDWGHDNGHGTSNGIAQALHNTSYDDW